MGFNTIEINLVWGCHHIWSQLHIWGSLHSWGHLQINCCLSIWGHLHIWGCLYIYKYWRLDTQSISKFSFLRSPSFTQAVVIFTSRVVLIFEVVYISRLSSFVWDSLPFLRLSSLFEFISISMLIFSFKIICFFVRVSAWLNMWSVCLHAPVSFIVVARSKQQSDYCLGWAIFWSRLFTISSSFLIFSRSSLFHKAISIFF